MADNSKFTQTICLLGLLGVAVSLPSGKADSGTEFCQEGNKTYEVGETWESEDCSRTECTCTIEHEQAISSCTSSSGCPLTINCLEGLRQVPNEELGCGCVKCEPIDIEPKLCPSVPGCAHYYQERGSKCCPKCRLTISGCPNVTCPPVVGCMRYAKQHRPGECCLRCARYREGEPVKGGVCGPIVCPKGQVCTNRGGVAKCMCKTCVNKNNPVKGSDGNTYNSYCHLQRAACQQCKVITRL